MTYHGITTQTIIRLNSAVLLIIGVGRIAVGIALSSQNKLARLVDVGLGPLIIALAVVVIVFPLSPELPPPIALGALALLFNGINKIARGTLVKEIPKWTKCILLGVGALNIFVSALVIITPSHGEGALARSISITLLITGIQMIISVTGLKKRRKSQVSL